MDAQLRPEHGPVRSAKREMIVVQKSQPTKRTGRVGFESTDFDFFAQQLTPDRPMRGLASLKGNTLPMKTVIDGLDHARILICK